MRRSRPGGAHYGGRAPWRTRSAGVRCGAARCVRRHRRCARTRAGTRLRGALGVGTAARRGGSMYVNEYIHMCVCKLYVYTYIIHLSIYVRIGRGYERVHQSPVCDGDGSAVCARVGGLVLRARPKPETLSRASRARRRRPRAASARRRSRRRRRSTPTSARGTPRQCRTCKGYAPLPARRRALWRTRSAGLRYGAAGCVRRHRRCARAWAHVQALGCAGPWV
jgi:hypothetical protein